MGVFLFFTKLCVFPAFAERAASRQVCEYLSNGF
jgi:hypothetical protein